MKKVLSMALALCLVLSMTACGSSSSGGDSADTSSDAQSQSQRVQPLAGAEIDTANLADGTYAVSFTPADVIDNAGQLQLHFTVYDYARYDAQQVSQLAAGDILVVDGKDLTVESVEQTNSDVIVNGGLEEDGVDLALGEDGNYYLSLMDDAKDYQSVGEATLPVDEDFVLTDNADQTNPNQTLLSGDLFSLQDDARGFTAENTTLTVEGGRLVSGQRVFVP